MEDGASAGARWGLGDPMGLRACGWICGWWDTPTRSWVIPSGRLCPYIAHIFW